MLQNNFKQQTQSQWC